MFVEIGQYYYGRLRRNWGVWKRTSEDSGEFIKGFEYKEQARDYVFEMNGWKKEKKSN